MKNKIKQYKITEQELPDEKIKKVIYKSDTMTIITTTDITDKDEFGFLKNDLPEYAR